MKKIIVSTFLLASLVACYKDDVILEEIQQEPLSKAKEYLSGDERVKMKRHKITPERAMLIAEDAKELFADENRVKTRSVSVSLLPVAITSHPKTRSVSGADTLMYVVNYSNNGGYVFVSNDDRDGDILMYSSGGNFQMKDTTDNPGLKLHVELMLGYQEHKLNKMRAAEANGEVYMGSMTTEEVSIDECLPNIMASTKGVVPGMPGGLPGHTCNVTGQPGMPGAAVTRKDICAPATYVSKDWQGHTDAIDLAQNKYRNQKCFGVPVLPPAVHFTKAGPAGQGHIDSQCASYPYCYPHVASYADYYYSYGCKMSMHIKTLRDTLYQHVAPLLTTRWNQHDPLKHNQYVAGCGPIAIMQILAYHQMPKTYGSREYGGGTRNQIRSSEKVCNKRRFGKITLS